MKPQELRLGNWVSVYESYHRLNEDGIEILFGERNYEDYTGVPLTPEILEKLGFFSNHDQESWDIQIDSGLLSIDKYDYSFAIFHNHSEMGFASNASLLKYLHQLQNLYFALTGEELSIEL